MCLYPIAILIFCPVFLLSNEVCFSLSSRLLFRIPIAKKTIKKECKRTIAERDAFEEVNARISNIERQSQFTEKSGDSLNQEAQTLLYEPVRSVSPNSAHLESIKIAFKETVMAVDHYDDEYGETFQEYLTNEFGTGLFELLASSSMMDSELQRALLDATQESTTRRNMLVQALNREAETLENTYELLEQHRSMFTDVKYSIESGCLNLCSDWDALCSLGESCQLEIIKRQEHLQSKYQSLRFWQVQQYLYQNQGWTFPVLGDAIDVFREIQATKHQLNKHIQRRS